MDPKAQADMHKLRRSVRDLFIKRLMTQPTKRIDGLTQAEIFLIEYLAEDGPLEQVEIRRRFWPLGEDQVSKLVSGLVNRGLVRRSRSTVDARIKVIELSDQGRQEAEVRQIIGNELTRRHFNRYTPEEIHEYHKAVDTLIRLDDKIRPRGDPPPDPREIDEAVSRSFAEERKKFGYRPLDR